MPAPLAALWTCLRPAEAAPDPFRTALDALPPAEAQTFAPVGTVPLGGGTRGVAVHLAPRLDGLPVDLVRVVRLGPDGRVRGITGDDIPPVAPDLGPPIPQARAVAVAGAAVGGDLVGARLSWQPVRGGLRRVWTVERTGPPSPHAPWRVPRVQIDAATGRILSVTDAAIDALPPVAPRARVYPHNPAVDPAPLEVTLPLAAEALSDDRVAVLQCRDLGDTENRTAPDDTEHALHVCTEVEAAPPAGGDYLYEPDPWPADPGRDEDDFPAPNVYWQVHRGLDWFDALGWTPRDGFDPRLEAVVNHRVTDLWTERTATDPALPLAPYRNAYFTGGWENADGEWIVPRLVFGQGPDTDFGYDGDVIHHELGHLVVRSVSGPSTSPDGPYGPSFRANALNEAFADYFSAAIHGDPLLSEYVIGDGTPVRDLGGPETCAASLTGEAHDDSLPFSTALWAARTALDPADRPVLDGAVLDSLAIMGRRADFPDAADAIATLVGERLGPEAQGVLLAAFDARGVRDCPPVTDVVPGPEPFRAATLVEGSYPWRTDWVVPAPIQFRVEIPAGGATVWLTFDQYEFLGFDPWASPPAPLGVVGRPGPDPIGWSVLEIEGDDGPVDAWIPDAPWVGVATATSSAPYPENDRYLRHRYEIAWPVEVPGPFVFQFTNDSPREAVAYDPTVVLVPLPPPPGPTGPTGIEALGRACGCATPAGAQPGWMLAGLAVLRRRRRFTTGPRP